jgi:cystathionine beta-lyase
LEFDFTTVIPRENTGSYKWDKYKGTDILPFWVADMDFAVAPVIIEAVRKRLDHPVFGYASAPDGLAPAIIDALQKEFDWTIEADWLVWLPGVVPGLSASCRAFGEAGDEAITCPPIYHHFLSVAQPAGKKLVTVPMLEQQDGRWALDFDGLEKAITPRSKLLLLCSPHNPLGRVFSQQELTRLCDLAARNNMIVVSDEVHCSLVLDDEWPHIPTARACPQYNDHIVTLMSPSKTFNLAGMNCSFAVIPNTSLRRRFIHALHGIVPMVPAMSYVAAEAAYRDGWEWHAQLIEVLRENYAYLRAEIATIPGISMAPMEATYLAWIDVSQLKLDNPVAFFEKAGLGFSAGREFGREGYGFIRLNFACPMVTLKAGVARLRKAVASCQA